MKKQKKETSILYVRLDSELNAEVDVIAKKEYRTKASVVKQAISEFLKKRRGKFMCEACHKFKAYKDMLWDLKEDREVCTDCYERLT